MDIYYLQHLQFLRSSLIQAFQRVSMHILPSYTCNNQAKHNWLDYAQCTQVHQYMLLQQRLILVESSCSVCYVSQVLPRSYNKSLVLPRSNITPWFYYTAATYGGQELIICIPLDEYRIPMLRIQILTPYFSKHHSLCSFCPSLTYCMPLLINAKKDRYVESRQKLDDFLRIITIRWRLPLHMYSMGRSFRAQIHYVYVFFFEAEFAPANFIPHCI